MLYFLKIAAFINIKAGENVIIHSIRMRIRIYTVLIIRTTDSQRIILPVVCMFSGHRIFPAII